MASHLKFVERVFLQTRRLDGQPVAAIAKELGRSRSALDRELQRNSVDGRYYAEVAEHKAKERRRKGRQRTRKMERPEVRDYVVQKLEASWSPEEISQRMKRDFPENLRLKVSGQTIYTWIHNDDHRRRWERKLRHYRARRWHLSHGPSKRPRPKIVDRPLEIDLRTRFGDWEGDTIIGRRQGGGALVSLVERRSRYVLLIYVPNLQSQTVMRTIARRLADFPLELRRSITFDRGTEFSDHAWLSERLGISIYFAHPGCPWERGSNEQMNGLVRQFFPKRTDFRDVSLYQIAKTQDLLNHRPRQCLGFQTPHEVLQQQCCRAIQT